MRLIDTHVHLDMPPLGDDPAGVLARAAAAGVTDVVVPAYDLASWDTIRTLAAAHPGVHPALGLHPWVADRAPDPAALAAALDTALAESGAVAVGEIGLDGKVESPPLAVQVPVLRAQLAVARERDLPVILHVRGAFDALLDLLAPLAPVRGVVHAFSRGPELARRFLALGLSLGFGGAVTRPRARRPRRSLATAPAGRFMLETDAPSIGLEGVPPEQAEPRHVREVALAAAALRGVAPEDIARETTDHARQLFRLP